MTASLAVAHLSKLTVFSDRGAGRWRQLAGLAVIAGLLVDGMTRPVPVATPPGKVILPGSQQAAVIELPVDSTDVSVQAMYRSIFHGRPLVNGYSGHFPPHYKILSLSLARLDSTALFYLARRRPLVIVVNDQFDQSRSYRDMVEGLPGIQRHGASGAGSVFLLPAQPAPREPPIGPALPATVRDVGRYLLEFDLGEPRLLSAVTFPLRRRYEELAARLRIETSEDGQTWTESWVGKTGGMARRSHAGRSAAGPDAHPAPRRQGAVSTRVSGVGVDEDGAERSRTVTSIAVQEPFTAELAETAEAHSLCSCDAPRNFRTVDLRAFMRQQQGFSIAR